MFSRTPAPFVPRENLEILPGKDKGAVSVHYSVLSLLFSHGSLISRSHFILNALKVNTLQRGHRAVTHALTHV